MLLLSHEEIRELSHRALCIGNRLLQSRNTFLRVFDWSPKRLPLFRDNGEKLFADPLKAAVASSPDQSSAGAFDQLL